MELTAIPIVATAISVIVAWALFGILCSLISEAIALALAERGRFMRKYLLKQLEDNKNNINWASKLYEHGTIQLLARNTKKKPTSDIAPHLFAETLVELVGGRVKEQNMDGKRYFESDLLNNFKIATINLKDSAVGKFLKQALAVAELCGKNDEAKVYDSLVLQIKAWYTQMTQRLTLWYGKTTRLRLFFLGLVLALVVNIDSVQLFTHFNTNPTARNIMIKYYEGHVDHLERLANRLDSSEKVTTLQTNSTEVQTDSAQQAAMAKKDAADSLKLIETRKELESYHASMDSLIKEADLPIGWENSLLYPIWHKDTTDKKINAADDTLANGGNTRQASMTATEDLSTMNICFRLIGILISGFAASFGAPFWFDLLKKVYSRKEQNHT